MILCSGEWGRYSSLLTMQEASRLRPRSREGLGGLELERRESGEESVTCSLNKEHFLRILYTWLDVHDTCKWRGKREKGKARENERPKINFVFAQLSRQFLTFIFSVSTESERLASHKSQAIGLFLLRVYPVWIQKEGSSRNQNESSFPSPFSSFLFSGRVNGIEFEMQSKSGYSKLWPFKKSLRGGTCSECDTRN